MRFATCVMVLAACLTSVPAFVWAQPFNVGSDQSDGALNLPASQGTIVFDPADSARWGRVLDPDGDGVFNFTTITIGFGTTLRFAADKVYRPIYFLASGDITIHGTLDLRGSNGITSADLGNRRLVALPGSGGFAGGAGGRIAGAIPATPGEGPGGGSGATLQCHTRTNAARCGAGGTLSSNRYLVPLIGGSGGSGGFWEDGNFYGGGAGGGAILVASSSSITFSSSGAILANGGDGSGAIGGGGSGGGIRLVAPTISVLSGSPVLDVRGGIGVPSGNSTTGVSGNGSSGLVRLERFTQNGTFGTPAGGAAVTVGSPVDVRTLRPLSTVRIISIAGVAVPAAPAGSFAVPDVTISNGGPVPVQIEASGIPPGTVVTFQVFPQASDDLTVVNLPTVDATLNGTLEKSTTTVNFTFPYGFSRGTLRATWSQ